MSPRPRKTVPQAQADEIHAALANRQAAVDQLAEADARLDRALVDALRHGASFQETASEAGLWKDAVQKAAARQGWPDAAEQELRRRKAEAEAEFQRQLNEIAAERDRQGRQ